jgi:hypothetical protein
MVHGKQILKRIKTKLLNNLVFLLFKIQHYVILLSVE